MLDFGWQELMVIAFVLVLVVGPKDLPRVLKAVAKTVSKARSMAGEFQSSMMEVANQEEFRDVRKAIDDARTGRIEAFDDVKDALEDASRDSGIAGDLGEIRSAGNELKRSVDGSPGTAKAKTKTAARKRAAGRPVKKRPARAKKVS